MNVRWKNPLLSFRVRRSRLKGAGEVVHPGGSSRSGCSQTQAFALTFVSDALP
jgi:hypothetical protein